MNNKASLTKDLHRHIEVAFPTGSTKKTRWRSFVMENNEAAPVVNISRDSCAGACATPVFFVGTPDPDQLQAIAESLYERTGRLAPLCHFLTDSQLGEHLVVTPLFHLLPVDAFAGAMTRVLQEWERSTHVAWFSENCEVTIIHDGVVYRRLLEPDGLASIHTSSFYPEANLN